MPRIIEFTGEADGRVFAHLRSDEERDLSAVVHDPAALIYQIAAAAGLTVVIADERQVGAAEAGDQ